MLKKTKRIIGWVFFTITPDWLAVMISHQLVAKYVDCTSNLIGQGRNPRKIRLIMLVDCDDKGEQSSYIEDDGDKKCIKEGAFKERHPGGLHEITMPMSKSYYWILHCHYCDNAHKTKIGDGNGPVVSWNIFKT